MTAVPTAGAVAEEPAMSRGQAFANLVGFLASLGVVCVAALLFTDQRTRQVDVSTVAVIALTAGLIGVAVAIGCIPDRPNPVWRESLAMLATVVPVLAALPAPAVVRILGPAVGALAVIPLVLTTHAHESTKPSARMADSSE